MRYTSQLRTDMSVTEQWRHVQPRKRCIPPASAHNNETKCLIVCCTCLGLLVWPQVSPWCQGLSMTKKPHHGCLVRFHYTTYPVTWPVPSWQNWLALPLFVLLKFEIDYDTTGLMYGWPALRIPWVARQTQTTNRSNFLKIKTVIG